MNKKSIFIKIETTYRNLANITFITTNNSKMGLCLSFSFPNIYHSSTISDSIFNKLYKDYLSQLNKKFSLKTIYFSEYDVPNEIKTKISKKLVIEFNKEKFEKYSFWFETHADKYISAQLAYYIFGKLINKNHEFSIQEADLYLSSVYEINFDFSDEAIENFKSIFFCKKDGTPINIETNEDKAVHKALRTKLIRKLGSIIDSIDFSQIIPLIVQSYQDILNNNKEDEKKVFDQIV